MLRFAYSASALRALLLRALVIWALVRVTVTAVYLVHPPVSVGNDGVAPSPPLLVVLVVSAILWTVDASRRGERALWGNLGLSFPALLLVQVVAATVGEAVMHVARR